MLKSVKCDYSIKHEIKPVRCSSTTVLQWIWLP